MRIGEWGEPMHIHVEALTKTYDDAVALDGVDLSLSSGVFGLLGPNGAGKTTLFQIMATIIKSTSGRVMIGNHDVVRDARKIRRMIGYLPQRMVYYDQLTGEEFVDYIALMKGMRERHTRRAEVWRVLETVHMAEHARAKIGTYSGGMKQRIGIAQAILGDPKLLIIDEPTVGLDMEERASLKHHFMELGEHRIVVLSTHIVSDIEDICDTLGILKHGKLLYSGETDQLLRMYSDRIWQACTFPEYLPYLQVKGRILHRRVVDGQLQIRFLSRGGGPQIGVEHPEEERSWTLDAVPVTPCLEDVYLSMTGG